MLTISIAFNVILVAVVALMGIKLRHSMLNDTPRDPKTGKFIKK